MTLERKTPSGKRAARSYCRRCLAVMLCCVLVFGVTVRVTPRAKADSAVASSYIGGNSALAEIAADPMSYTGVYLLAAAGLEFVNGYFSGPYDSPFYSPAIFEWGADCWAALSDAGSSLADWCFSVESEYPDGLSAGDSIVVPAEVLAQVKSWAVANIDFSDGAVTFTNQGLVTADGTSLIFSDLSAESMADWQQNYRYKPYYPFTAGTIFSPLVSVTLKEDYTFWLTSDESKVYLMWGSDQYYSTQYFASQEPYGLTFVWVLYDGVPSVIPALVFMNGSQQRARMMGVDCRVALADLAAQSAATTVTMSPQFEDEVTEDTVVKVPSNTLTIVYDGVSIPVIGELAPDDVLTGTDEDAEGKEPIVVPGTGVTAGEITQAITDALPITGSIAGDQVVSEVLEDPDSLGAVFISKFPFCIPWDIVQAFRLLAAPPQTPRWELDFLAPMAYRVGGFEGDTTVVIDFGQYPIVGVVTRWVSTVLFLYALASATKRLLWTA